MLYHYYYTTNPLSTSVIRERERNTRFISQLNQFVEQVSSVPQTYEKAATLLLYYVIERGFLLYMEPKTSDSHVRTNRTHVLSHELLPPICAAVLETYSRTSGRSWHYFLKWFLEQPSPHPPSPPSCHPRPPRCPSCRTWSQHWMPPPPVPSLQMRRCESRTEASLERERAEGLCWSVINVRKIVMATPCQQNIP